MTASENWTVDKLLKKVYSVHKQSVNDLTAELTRCKENLQRSEERLKELQTENEHLFIENKRLSVVEANKQASNGSCCEVIRHSLQMVNTSYKELLKDKDQRIKHLEEELNKYRRRFNAADSLPWSAIDNSQDSVKKKHLKRVGNSPDSTSKSTTASQSSVVRVQVPNSPIPDIAQTEDTNAAETIAEKSPDDSQKLRLQRRGKRSRYSEDISPEMKRPRHKSGSPNSSKSHKHSKKMLVQDTCNHLEGNKERDIDSKSTDKPAKKGSNLEETVLIVPETMAVDDDYVDSELDDEDIISNEFPHKLSTIEEMSEATSSVLSNDCSKNLQVDKTIDKDRQTRHDKLSFDTDELSHHDNSRDSDHRENVCGNDSLYEAISDIGASVVDDSNSVRGLSYNDETVLSLENDTFHEEDNSKKSTDKDFVLDTTHRSHPLGGRCKNIEEVNELFETPESKGKTATRQSQVENAGNKRKLFKKCVLTDISGDAIKLRRSPRKKKEFESDPMSEQDGCRKPVARAVSELKSARKHLKNESSTKDCDDNDLTMAPDTGLSNAENQSMDLYQVVPVKNGEPVMGKQFQMKVRKNKYDTKSSMKDLHKHVDRRTVRSPMLSSPEAYSVTDMKGQRSRAPEVICVTSSPSIGSVSDPESPLLLKTSKTDKQVTGKGQAVQSKPKSDVSLSSPIKVNRSRSSNHRAITQGNDKTRNPNKGTGVDEQQSQGESPRSKSLRQTTLTQRFFSPKKKHTKIFKSTSGDMGNTKTVLFDEDSNGGGYEDVTVPDDSIAFKRPTNPANKEGLMLKRKGNKQVDLDETIQSNDTDQHPLQDVSSKHLNGSLDPAAELSMLCGEPETFENQPIKSLPSLDTDFCAEDLVSDQASLQKTSTLMAEESEDMPSSYRFMPKKKAKEIQNKENVHVSLDDSFDRPPKKASDNVPHIAVVRKKDERQKLQGYGCKQCEEYYKSTGRSDEEVKSHMNQCSRHRAQYLPPDTPPHFWSVGFIDTQECVDRGYMKIDDNQSKKGEDGNPHRRRRRLNKYFKSKTEGSNSGSDEELVYD